MVMKKTPEEISLIRILRRQGFSQNRIARLLGISTSTVCAYTRGICQDVRANRHNPAPLTPDLRRLITQYHDGTLRLPATPLTQPLMRDFRHTPARRLLTLKQQPQPPAQPVPHPDIYTLVRQGATIGDIAVSLGITLSECSLRFRQHIAWLRLRPAGTPT